MTTIVRWISYFVIVVAMTVAPALIAIGLATSAKAQPTTGNSTSKSAHLAFPNQNNFPEPGSRLHHHHQRNRHHHHHR
jgi:hypothetical protein